MLKEALTYLTTPCDPAFAKMGYLKGQVDIGVRHGRCQKSWAPHLEKTKDMIRRAIGQTTGRGRAVVLGSGHLYDVPLKALVEAFDEVVLVDVVHPKPAKRAAKKYENVRLEERDISGIAEGVLDAAKTGGVLPLPQPPTDLGDADLIVSVNLLSQLPIWPQEVLMRSGHYGEDQVDQFSVDIVRTHLNWLNSLSGTVCLVSDVERQESHGQRYDLWHGVTPPSGGKSWAWNIAPRPEIFKDRDVVHMVRGWVFKEGTANAKTNLE